MNTYDIGDLVTLTAAFTDPSTSEPVDPDTVTCKVRQPDGKVVPLEVLGSDGVYTAAAEVTADGRWFYAWDGRGNYQASQEGQFAVRKQRVPR